MPTTTNRGYPYPSGAVGVPPDVPGDLYRLAAAIDADLGPGTASSRPTTPTAWTPHFNYATNGDGINLGVYWYTAGGQILNGKFDWTWGSTSTMATTASNQFTIDLPNSAVPVPHYTNIGSGSIKDLSTGAVYHTDLIMQGSPVTIGLYLAGSASGPVLNDGTPFTFAAGDHVSGTFSIYVQ